MKKTACKTAAYTLLFALACIGLAFSILSLFCPRTMSDIYFETGSNRLAARYAVLAAERSADVERYALAAERSYVAAKHADVVTWGNALLGHDEFSAYSAFRDEAAAEGQVAPTGSYADYVGSMIATSMYRMGKEDEAIAFAAQQDGARYGVRAGLVFVAVTASDDVFAQKIYENLVANPVDSDEYRTDVRVLKTYLGIQS